MFNLSVNSNPNYVAPANGFLFGQVAARPSENVNGFNLLTNSNYIGPNIKPLTSLELIGGDTANGGEKLFITVLILAVAGYYFWGRK